MKDPGTPLAKDLAVPTMENPGTPPTARDPGEPPYSEGLRDPPPWRRTQVTPMENLGDPPDEGPRRPPHGKGPG